MKVKILTCVTHYQCLLFLIKLKALDFNESFKFLNSHKTNKATNTIRIKLKMMNSFFYSILLIIESKAAIKLQNTM